MTGGGEDGWRKVWQEEVNISTKKEGKEDNKETDKELKKETWTKKERVKEEGNVCFSWNWVKKAANNTPSALSLVHGYLGSLLITDWGF